MRPVKFNYKITKQIKGGFHAHPNYEIYYFHEGKCNYIIGPQMYALQPGDLIIMHGMTMHSPNVDRKFPYVRSMYHFEPQFLNEFMNKASMAPLFKPFEELRNYRLHTGQYREEIEELLLQMNQLYQDGDAMKYERFLLRFVDLLYIINELCEQPMMCSYTPSSEKERHVQHVIEYIEQHFTDDITMDDIQRDLHVNKHYLSRLFKAWTGSTIFNFLYNRRINQAKTLFMVHEQISVTEVAKRVGFKHGPHFSRVFKQAEGCSPDAYRKSLLKNKL